MSILIDAPRWPREQDGQRFADLASDASRAELTPSWPPSTYRGRLRFHADHYDVPAAWWDAVVEQGACVGYDEELVRRLRAAGLRHSRR